MIDENYRVTGELAKPFDIRLGEELRQAVALKAVDDLWEAIDKVLEERSENIETDNCELSLVGAGLCLSDSLTYYLGQGLKDETVVVLARLFSNSTPSALHRAIDAYRRLDLSIFYHQREGRAQTKRAKRLNEKQCVRLAQRYECGATVYELASEFAIDRRTVSLRLRDQGITLRRQSPTDEMVDEMIRLYFTGLSAAKIGKQISVSADTVLIHLRQRGVDRRASHRPRL